MPAQSVRELVNQLGEAVVQVQTPSGLGSGFIINKDGYLMTNFHVIEGETRISAILYQNVPSGLARRRIENVEIVALNPFMDLALLKLPAQKELKYNHVVLGSLDDLNAGDGVFAVTHIGETPGVYLDESERTPETIAARSGSGRAGR